MRELQGGRVVSTDVVADHGVAEVEVKRYLFAIASLRAAPPYGVGPCGPSTSPSSLAAMHCERRGRRKGGTQPLMGIPTVPESGEERSVCVWGCMGAAVREKCVDC
jgi:hypothetical protein